MEITQEQLKYISGESFSSSYNFKILEKFESKTRIKMVLEKTRQKKILHVGCVDHIDLIDEKINSGNYLHKLLTQNAKKCIGIDINKEGINLLKDEYNFDNVFYADLLSNELEIIKTDKWDCIVLGEILEHVENPVEFLHEIKKKYKDFIEKIIITVPNALNNQLLRIAKKSKVEYINSDHKYWFTPFTILKVMSQAGIEPVDLSFAGRVKLNHFELFKKQLKTILGRKPKYFFNYFNTLVVTGNL